MTFTPLKVGEPINEVLRLNYLFNKAAREVSAGVAPTARFARMWHRDAELIAGPAALSISNTGYFPYGAAFEQTLPNPILHVFENYFTLDAGTYDFRVLCRTANDAGILQWFIDNVSIGTMDFYSAGAVNYVQKTIAGITIGTSGAHTLKGDVTTKHASSSNYFIPLHKYCLVEA
jgi:hypothetical protein